MPEKRKKVWLSISGSSKNEEENDDVVEFLTEGDLYRDSDNICVSYEESEVSGMDGTTTTLYVNENKVSVVRLGTINSVMNFEIGKRNTSLYSTPFGDVPMGIVTKDLSIDYNEKKEPIAVMVDYNIEVSGKTNSQNTLNIKIS